MAPNRFRRIEASKALPGASPALVRPAGAGGVEFTGRTALVLRGLGHRKQRVQTARDLRVAPETRGRHQDAADEPATRLAAFARCPVHLRQDILRQRDRDLGRTHGIPSGMKIVPYPPWAETVPGPFGKPDGFTPQLKPYFDR